MLTIELDAFMKMELAQGIGAISFCLLLWDCDYTQILLQTKDLADRPTLNLLVVLFYN